MIDLIRAPNHLGDFVLALPALEAAPRADVLVARHLEPLARLALPGRVILPLSRGGRGLRARRGRSTKQVENLGHPAHTVILLGSAGEACAAYASRRGTDTDHRGALLYRSGRPLAARVSASQRSVPASRDRRDSRASSSSVASHRRVGPTSSGRRCGRSNLPSSESSPVVARQPAGGLRNVFARSSTASPRRDIG